jgi:four helix bundle protein
MKLEELNVYRMAMEMADKIWDIVTGWDYFAKDTVGKQMVKAADSIAANLSEGFRQISLQGKNKFQLLFPRFLI